MTITKLNLPHETRVLILARYLREGESQPRVSEEDLTTLAGRDAAIMETRFMNQAEYLLQKSGVVIDLLW